MKPPRRIPYSERVQAYIDFRWVPDQTCGLWVTLIRNLPGEKGEVCLHGALSEGEVSLEAAMRRVAQALTERGVTEHERLLMLGRGLCQQVGRSISLGYTYMELSNRFTTQVAEFADTLQQEAAGPDTAPLSLRELRRLRVPRETSPAPRKRSLLVAGVRLPVTVSEGGQVQLHLPNTRVLVFEDTPKGRKAVLARAHRALTRAAAHNRHVQAAYPDAEIEGSRLRLAHLDIRLFPQPRLTHFPLDVLRFGDRIVLIDPFDTACAERIAERRAERSHPAVTVTPGT